MAKKMPEESPEQSADKKLLLELRERYKKCVEHDRENRKKYKENMEFALVPGSQWDAITKKERGNDRPMYEFNEIRIKGKAIVNQIRSNRPSAKITPAEEGDIKTAEAMKALISQIENASDAESVMDYATEHQVFGGMGAERYITKYCEDSVDEQDIVIEPVKNPMCLYADYAAQKQDKSDARFWILATKLTKETYKAKYPNAKPVEFDIEDEFEDDCDDDHVWVAEYWKQKPITRELALLSDGKTVDLSAIQALPEGVTVLKSRKVNGYEIVQYICSGDAVLADESGEKEHPWAGKHFPFNVVYGEYSVVDGKEVWRGLPEYGKDAQRAHNWAATSVYEAIATAPQGTTWVTVEQAKGRAAEWAEAIRKNIRLKIYNHDPKAPGPPVSEPPASIPTALVAAMQMSSDSLKAVLGMPDATLGEKGAENSGVAIRRRQEAGAVANYNFGDNVNKFARRRYEILLDLIPKVIDTPRQVRVLGKDGAEEWIAVNQVDPVTGEKINDLSAPKYDLVVTPSPSFATQRQEAAELYTQLSQANPALMQLAPDIIFHNLDLPGAQEIAERMKASLPPQIQQMLNKDKAVDPAVAAAMQQVELLQQQVQEQAALVEQASSEAQAEKSQADKAKSDVQVAVANLKVQEAQIGKQVAEFQRLVAETQAKMAVEQSQKDTEDGKADVAADREQLSAQLNEALIAIQQQAAAMLQQYAEALAQMQAQTLEVVQAKSAPKQKTIRLVRKNGGLTGEVTEIGPDGQPTTTVVEMQRQDGQLVGQATPTVQ